MSVRRFDVKVRFNLVLVKLNLKVRKELDRRIGIFESEELEIVFWARADWVGIYPRDNSCACVIADFVVSQC